LAIEQKISFEDLIPYELFRNPILLNEFIENYDKTERDEPYELTWYQKEFLGDMSSYVSIIAGRSAGKTVSVVGMLRWVLTYNVFPQDYICYLVPNRSQLEPVFTGLVRSFRTNSLLKQFISPSSGINSSDYKITLLNMASLICKIAGQTGDGRAVIGTHTPLFVVDESGYEPWGTWIELQPTVNTFTPGFRLVVAGVPDGRREKSVCYFADQISSIYSKHRISSDMNPRLTEKDRQAAIEQYGGEDSDDFIHLWKAQHGKPVFALFDRGNFAFGDDPVYKLTLNGTQIGEMLSEYLTKIDIFPSLPSKEDKAILCVDLGYTEPTAIIILYQDRLGRLRFHGRIEMTKVSYPIQEKLLNVLDSKFNPALIGIDRGAGGQGISVVQHMMEDLEYAHKDYQKRLVPVDFSTSIVIGIDSDGNEIKSKTKPFATSVLQEYANNHKIMFSHKDLEMVNELERMTYSRTPTGEIVYKTLTQKGGKSGSDHFTAALLCGIMAYYIKNDFMLYKSERKVLARPSWI
jgi:hypothetical protein